MTLPTFPVPDDYKCFRLLACGYWDEAAKDGQAEVFVAAPNRAAAECFVRYSGLYVYLDESYSVIPEAAIEEAHVLVNKRGDVITPTDLSDVRTALRQAAAPFMIFDTEGRQVINAGSAGGKTWLFTYVNRPIRDGTDR